MDHREGLPAEAEFMDLNPRIEMFRRLNHKVVGTGNRDESLHDTVEKHMSRQVTEDSIQMNSFLEENKLKPVMNSNKA